MSESIFSLNNKVVLITGGSGHLGKAMSEAIAEHGGTLIVASRNKERNGKLSAQLKEKYDVDIFTYFLDLSDYDCIDGFVSNIIKEHNKIDVLINNSYYGAGSDLLNMTNDQWQLGIDGSIGSTFRLSKAVLSHMVEQGSGKIINIASMYGVVAPDVSIYEENDFYNPVNYGVGKAGIIQMTKYIASVYASSGITCNAISPGPFPNPDVQNDIKFINALENKVPLKRIGQPEDLKGVITLLASNASDYINGVNISVDGGWTIW